MIDEHEKTMLILKIKHWLLAIWIIVHNYLDDIGTPVTYSVKNKVKESLQRIFLVFSTCSCIFFHALLSCINLTNYSLWKIINEQGRKCIRRIKTMGFTNKFHCTERLVCISITNTPVSHVAYWPLAPQVCTRKHPYPYLPYKDKLLQLLNELLVYTLKSPILDVKALNV